MGLRISPSAARIIDGEYGIGDIGDIVELGDPREANTGDVLGKNKALFMKIASKLAAGERPSRNGWHGTRSARSLGINDLNSEAIADRLGQTLGVVDKFEQGLITVTGQALKYADQII